MKKKMTKTQPKIDPKIIDELLKSYEKPDDLLGEGGIVEQLTKALIERALQGEMTHHLGYEKHSVEGALLQKFTGHTRYCGNCRFFPTIECGKNIFCNRASHFAVV